MWFQLLIAAALSGAAPTPAEGRCQSAPGGRAILNSAGQSIFVRTVGTGPPILMIPSLARGSNDFDALAKALAAHGFQTLLPDPRGTGRSSRAPARDLFELAGDDLAVIRTLCKGRVDVLGHAFGNRVARALATAAPDRVADVVLLAGGGEAPPTERTIHALQGSLSQGRLPDAERLEDLHIAFFAKGQDPSVWLSGWYPEAATLERKAGAATPLERWWKAGSAPVFLIQALEDPVAPPANADALLNDLGDRLTRVDLPHASHAILPEQPDAVAALLIAYLQGERDAARLRDIVAATLITPQ